MARKGRKELSPNKNHSPNAGSMLRDVTRLYARAQRAQAICLGITVAECHVLSELGRAGTLPMSELVKRLGLHKGWVSRTVAALEEEGNLKRDPDPQDGRAQLVSLTKGGSKRFRRLDEALNRHADAVIELISAGERAATLKHLSALRDALAESMCDTAPDGE
jgi:DNA-binding MarR family transcriptional regulator